MAPVVSHVLLMPEDVAGQSPSSQPMYGSVINTDGPLALIGLQTPPNVTVQVTTEGLSSRRVPADEFELGAPGLWLRQAVVGKADGKYVSGQVTAYSEGIASVHTAQGTVESLISDLIEVPPVLCFLLSRLDKMVEDLPEESLLVDHELILDRLLGRNGQRPTRAVSRLLREIAPHRQQPNATDTLQWINARSGMNSTVSVRHVIDYVYYKEGGRRIPSSQQGNIGGTFDEDPSYASSVPLAADDGENDDLDVMLNRIVAHASTPDPSQFHRNSPNQEQLTQSAERTQPRNRPLTDAQHHSKVLTAIADDPDLIRFYLSMCQKPGTKQSASPSTGREAQRRRIEGPSDLFDMADVPTRPSKHAFNPTATQQAVNRLLISSEHEGKPPSALIEAMISSRSTKFKPHPAIMTRVYAIEFGRRGLTLLHFVRFDFAARRAWYANGSVNLNNFSASLTLPKAIRPKSLDDVSNALTVLHLFAEEFFDQETCRLISCAREFVEELRSFCQWSGQDVETLNFWFDTVFEDYRTASENDARHGTSTRSTIKSKMSLQDPDLQSVLYVIQSERLSSLMATPSHRISSKRPKAKDSYRRVEGSRSVRKTPQEVLDVLPRQGRQTVCMKYLSANGCASKSDERCTFPNHAHFIPEEVNPIIIFRGAAYVSKHSSFVSSVQVDTSSTTSLSTLPYSTYHYIPPEPFHVTPQTVVGVRDVLKARLHIHEAARRRNIVSALRSEKLPIPHILLENKAAEYVSSDLNRILIKCLSELVSRRNLSLSETVALRRNESCRDTRPNKALDPEWLNILLHEYSHKDIVLEAARFGVSHTFLSPRVADTSPVRNHKSAQKYSKALLQSIGEGQSTGTYMGVNMDTALRWSELRFSPFGCVPKKGVDPEVEARLIHDLSWPDSTSTNACSIQEELPDLIFVPVRLLAQRIEDLAASDPGKPIKMLKGDVKWTFRNIPVAARLAAHFSGTCTGNEAVIDLALPFGWAMSPAHYSTFGEAISFMVSRESPNSLDPRNLDKEPFFAYVWVDDHIILEIDRDQRLAHAEAALKLSMMAALGPNAINGKKFSTWSSQLEALGLTWDTETRVVSMPADKIDKALARISKVLSTKRICKHQLEKLLGSLRHVGLCCRASRAFIQRLHYTWKKASKFVKINLNASVCEDLYWIQAILKRGGMNRVSTSIIAGTIDIDVNLFMDASNSGLCVLYPAAREYIRVHFDTEEISAISITTDETNSVFSINVREALSAVFATIVWGPRWSRIARTRGVPVHARCWIDNTSAVSWIKRHFSSNSYGQELMRVLSCAETEFELHISTAHLHGSTNVLADMGSRAWTGDHLKQWTNAVSCWTEQAIPPHFRKIYNINSPNYNGDRSLTQLEKSTWEHGVNGVPSAPVPVCPPGSTSTISTVNRFNWLCSRLAAGKETTKMVPADLTPFGLKSAMCAGVISSVPGSGHVCFLNMNSHRKGCEDSAPRDVSAPQYRSRCSKLFSTRPSGPAPSTASFVGLRCWASSFVSVEPST